MNPGPSLVDAVASSGQGDGGSELAPQEIRERALAVLQDPAFFYRLGLLLETGWKVPSIRDPRFIVGEEENKRLIPFLLAGVELELVNVVQLRGPPATAKDSLIALATDLLPFKVKRLGYFTPAAMRYGESASLLYLQDAPTLDGETARHLRFLRSDDGGLEWEYARRDPETGEMTTERGRVGIKGVVTTTNELRLDPALASGAWVLDVDSSPALGTEVKRQRLRYHAGGRETVPQEELEIWRGAFRLALEDPPQVRIPWAEKLLPLVSGTRTATRRSPDKLCNLIRLVATFRRYQKEKPEEADLVDLFVALRIGRGALLGSLGDLEPNEKVVLDKVRSTGEVVVKDICVATGWSNTTCYNLLESLVKKGYLTKVSEGRKNLYATIPVETEMEGLDLSLTFSESSETSGLIIRALGDLGFDLSIFHEGGVIDPLTGKQAPYTHTPGKMERSEGGMNKGLIIGTEGLHLSMKGDESSDRTESLTEQEKAVLSFVRRNASRGVTATNVMAAMAAIGIDPGVTKTMVELQLDANVLKKDELGFLGVARGAGK